MGQEGRRNFFLNGAKSDFHTRKQKLSPGNERFSGVYIYFYMYIYSYTYCVCVYKQQPVLKTVGPVAVVAGTGEGWGGPANPSVHQEFSCIHPKVSQARAEVPLGHMSLPLPAPDPTSMEHLKAL